MGDFLLGVDWDLEQPVEFQCREKLYFKPYMQGQRQTPFLMSPII